MAENELKILINEIFSRIKEKNGYTDKQALIYLKGYEDCAKEHQQSLEKRDKMLRDTVAELCEAKKLLKLAVEDIHELLCDRRNLDGIGQSCNVCSYIDNCPCCNRCDIIPELRTWRYADEALKLIKEE